MKARFTAAPDVTARVPGTRIDVRYMTRSQIFKSVRQISIGVLAVALAGAAGVAAFDPRKAFGPAAFFEGLSVLSMAVAGLGALGTTWLLACGLTREHGYDPVAVWRADVQGRGRGRFRRRVRSAIDLCESGVSDVRASGADLVLDMETYVHQSTGQPGYDSGTGWYFPARLRIHSARVRGHLPRLPGAIADGAVHVGSRQLRRVVPAPFEFRGLTRVEFALEGGGILVVEGDGVSAALRGAGRFIENREA